MASNGIDRVLRVVTTAFALLPAPAEGDAQLDEVTLTQGQVVAGIAVVDAATGRKKTCFEVSKVKMRRIPASEITRLSKKHLDKAGAYAIQEKSDAFVEKIEGDYFNVVGLPYHRLKKLLSFFGVTINMKRSSAAARR